MTGGWRCRPTKALGTVAEAECARWSPLDLAELSAPVEWFRRFPPVRHFMDSGTENMDWCHACAAPIITFTRTVVVFNVGRCRYQCRRTAGY